MDAVNKTLYIPLYGKAMVSKKGIILNDPKAELIWEQEGFALKGKSKSKWLTYYMGMRSAVFDRWTMKQLRECPDAVVLHIGCGMDSRCERVFGNGKSGEEESVQNTAVKWYDVDFPAVISERKKYYAESASYHMIEADARETDWIGDLPKASRAIIVMEGISMYLDLLALIELLIALKNQFPEIHLLTDCYTELGAKASRIKNPVKDVGVTTVWGLDHPEYIAEQTGLAFIAEHDMTPEDMIDQLEERERKFLRVMFGGKMAKKLYRLYEYKGD